MVFGNRHELENVKGENKHKWTMFVKCADKKLNAIKLISKVRYGLHETFGAEYLDIMGSNDNTKFEMTMRGWGTFEIPITMFLKFRMRDGKKDLQVSHYLSFDGNGANKSISLFLNKDQYEILSN